MGWGRGRPSVKGPCYDLIVIALLVALLLAGDLSAAHPPVSPPLPDKVTIGVYCEGLDGARAVSLALRRLDSGYVDDRYRRYAASLVGDLVSRMREPTGDPLSLATLHISQSDMAARAEALIATWRLSPSQRIELRRRMSESGLLEQVVAGHFTGGFIDHGCDTSVEISFGAQSRSASSRSEHPFGVPWTIEGRRSWDSRLGSSIGALLPADFDYQRRQFLALGFLDEVAEEWVRRGAAPH